MKLAIQVICATFLVGSPSLVWFGPNASRDEATLLDEIRKTEAASEAITEVNYISQVKTFSNDKESLFAENRCRFIRGEGRGRVLVWEERGKTGEWKGDVYAENPRYQFHLSRLTESSDWVVQTINLNPENKDETITKWLELSENNCFKPAVCLYDNKEFLDVFEADDTTLKLDTDGTGELSITIESRSKDLKFPKYFANVKQDEFWHLNPVRMTSREGNVEVVRRFEGVGQNESAPTAPSRFTFDVIVEGKRTSTTDIQYQNVTSRVLPKSEFRLTAFGIPEPPEVRSSNSTWYYVIIGSLIFLGICGFVIRRRGQSS